MGSLKDHYFGDKPYPSTPGFKTPGTSEDAARAMRGHSVELRRRTLDAIRGSGMFGLTADQVAFELGANILAIRPRVSELAADGEIIKTEERRANASGLKASVWRAK